LTGGHHKTIRFKPKRATIDDANKTLGPFGRRDEFIQRVNIAISELSFAPAQGSLAQPVLHTPRCLRADN
jgi:hypothetical protein